MENHISTVLNQLQREAKILPELQQTVLDSYDHIELTPEELAEVIIEAKRRKEAFLENQKVKEAEANNRKLLTGKGWTYNQTDSFMTYRAGQLFKGKFVKDRNNEMIYMLLCFYFSNDISFISLAESLGVKNPSLDKGLFLGGMIGVGKTWLMRLFAKNQRQVFIVKTAKSIADSFQVQGEGSLLELVQCPKLPVNDVQNFYHAKMGICIDDIGTEDLKNHYGNRKNVVGDLIELRYANGNVGDVMHLTTNLTMPQIKEFYGDRVGSRLRETMNIIELKGEDRRK